MNPLKSLIRAFSPKNSLESDLANSSLFGWHPTGGINTLEHYRDNQFENGYGSITKIVNAFMEIKPYAVDENANRVTNNNVINRLYHPNSDMSSSDFREALAVMCLIHDRVFVLVWRSEGGVAKPGGAITPDNLAGFTFLENPIVTLIGNKKTYTYQGATYTEDEVIELKDINPYNLHRGFSPARAASKWATIDDYIAAYQTGFFKNGAVPAGQFIITASTPQEFNDEVDKLEAKHKGAGKNNNIVYVHRPTDREGKPSNAKIEWVPFNVVNKDLSLNDLFVQANSKIDGVYGVPAEIRGILSNSNYASVNVAEKIFIKYVVKPFTQKIWTRFTHQLNRITGGLGVAISFELEVPGLVDEEKVEEETKKIRDERVDLYLERGYTLSSIQKYLDTDDLTQLESNAPLITEGNDDVDEGDEVEDAPDVPDGTGNGTTYNKVKNAVSPDPAVDASLVPYEQDIENVLKSQIDKQAQRTALSITDEVEEATEEEDDLATEAILAILLLLLLMRGNKNYSDGVLMAMSAGLDITQVGKFSGSITDSDRKYMADTVKGFNSDTAAEINKLVATMTAAGATSTEIKSKLDTFSSTQGLRTNRFAQNEAWRTSEKAGLAAMTQLTTALNSTKIDSQDTNQKAGSYKTWNIQPSACPICVDYAGITIPINEQFFGGLDIPPAHVACRCKATYSIVKESTTSNKVEKELHCTACDRFLGVTTNETYTDKLKCSNSSCKALDVPTIKEMK